MTCKTIAIANQKGGVGKTATAVNLSANLAHLGKKTLLIDLDYQANSTSNLGLKQASKIENRTSHLALSEGLPLKDCILETDDENLHLLAGGMGLSKLSREKILDPGSALILKQYLTKYRKKYDYIVIDTHPSLDLLFQMTMTASDYYLVPMFAEADPFDGLQYMFQEIGQIKSGLNPGLSFLGIVITKFDKLNSTHGKFAELLKTFGKENGIAIRAIIPDSKALASSSSYQKPLLWFKPSLPVSKAYTKLAGSLNRELSKKKQKVTRKGASKKPALEESSEQFLDFFGETQNVEIFE